MTTKQYGNEIRCYGHSYACFALCLLPLCKHMPSARPCAHVLSASCSQALQAAECHPSCGPRCDAAPISTAIAWLRRVHSGTTLCNDMDRTRHLSVQRQRDITLGLSNDVVQCRCQTDNQSINQSHAYMTWASTLTSCDVEVPRSI